MECPDCNTEMNHIADYSEEKDDIRYEEYCPVPSCSATFTGVLVRRGVAQSG